MLASSIASVDQLISNHVKVPFSLPQSSAHGALPLGVRNAIPHSCLQITPPKLMRLYLEIWQGFFLCLTFAVNSSTS